ncbi:hypothetical protein TNCV_4684141 [Trichonephila clavipes]|nr:hypothetical protein TNCV_4684141 [Trichonephila clavipes]
MPLDNKCRIGPLAGAPPTHVRWSSALRLNRDSSLKMMHVSSLSHSKLPEVGKNPVDTAYDVRATTISAPTEVAADTSIRPTCFSEAYYAAPIKVRQLLVLPPGCVLRGILSLNIVYQSHQIRLDSRTALVLMLLNSPSCATNSAHSTIALSRLASKF